MSTSNDDLVGLVPTNFAVPVGATLAVYVDITSGEKNVTFKLTTGGTLEILGVTYGTFGNTFYAGSTLSAGALSAANGTGYIVQSEVLSFDGPMRFYLSATGATCVVHMIKAFAARS